jgi:uncharacterized protein
MIYFICCLVAFLGSGLTLFSGFGLGTLMTPVFALFFPVELAVALTAIVHFLNNVFKLVLMGKHANKEVILKFGLISIAAAFLGAYLLTLLSDFNPLFEYYIGNHLCIITPVKLVIAILLLFFVALEVIPALANLEFNKKWLPLGGLLSGFFGGLSGNQGALRSAFLSRAGLSKEAFIGTGVVLACFIDVTRLGVYSKSILAQVEVFDYVLIIASTLSAFAGAFIGSKLIKKLTVRAVQVFVTLMLFLFAMVLGSGILH